MSRKDAVPPEMALAVFARDGGCVAPRLGGSMMDCFGRNQIAHVKVQPRMGKRAEPQMDRLVTLCDGHTEPGMKAGRIWCTDKGNIALLREYLRSVTA
jgi:hypothetical protein